MDRTLRIFFILQDKLGMQHIDSPNASIFDGCHNHYVENKAENGDAMWRVFEVYKENCYYAQCYDTSNTEFINASDEIIAEMWYNDFKKAFKLIGVYI